MIYEVWVQHTQDGQWRYVYSTDNVYAAGRTVEAYKVDTHIYSDAKVINSKGQTVAYPVASSIHR